MSPLISNLSSGFILLNVFISLFMTFDTVQYLLLHSWPSLGFQDIVPFCSPTLMNDSSLFPLLAFLPPPMTKLWVSIKAIILAVCSSSLTLIPSSPLQWTSLYIDCNCQSQCCSVKKQYLNSNCLWSIFTWITSQWHLKFTLISIHLKLTYSFSLLSSH